MSDLTDRIEAVTTAISNARQKLLEVKETVIKSKEDLKDIEAYLLPEIVGKNQAERDANLRMKTENQRRILWANEMSEHKSSLELELALDARRSLENIIRIMELEV